MEAATTDKKETAEGNGRNTGRIEEIQGVVIEAVFPDELPEIYSAITVDRGEDGLLTLRAGHASTRSPARRRRSSAGSQSSVVST